MAKSDLRLEELTIDEIRQKFVAPQVILEKAYGLPKTPLTLRSGMGYTRSAAEPAFTVTSNAQSFGHTTNDMRRITGTVMLQMIGVDADQWVWPEGTSETTKLKLGSQVVPPAFAAYLQLAKHNSRMGSASRGADSKIFGGEVVVMWSTSQMCEWSRCMAYGALDESQRCCLARHVEQAKH